MTEIEKLRARLQYVNRGVTEYKMSIVEAKNLLKEIDIISKKEEDLPVKVDINEPAVRTRIIDGGVF